MRALLTLVVLPLLTAGLGFLAATMVSDPSDVVSSTPVSTIVTDEVVRTVLESAVVARGDVVQKASFVADLAGDVYVGSQPQGQPVYTGRLAQVGDQVQEADVLAEISGRPVFVIKGQIPMYRSLGPGSVGADVEQLETVLRRLGHFEGSPDQTYSDATETAVAALYDDMGYPPAVTGPSIAGMSLDMAQDAVDAARAALAEAEHALSEADVAATRGEILSAKAAILAAEEAREAAKSSQDAVLIAQAEADLVSAREQLEQLRTPRDLTTYDRAIDAARAELSKAVERHDLIDASTGVAVPRGEVVTVPVLPRLVGAVGASIGEAPGAEAFTLVDANAEVVVQLPRDEAGLVKKGQEAKLFEDSLGLDATGTVRSVSQDATQAGLRSVSIVTDTDLSELVGANARVRFPVASTDDEVLAVSIAAVYTDADGRTFVDRVTDMTPGQESVKPVEVSLGLKSASMVAIKPRAPSLNAGDRVSVGQR